jgi:hypothetical protein
LPRRFLAHKQYQHVKTFQGQTLELILSQL